MRKDTERDCVSQINKKVLVMIVEFMCVLVLIITVVIVIPLVYYVSSAKIDHDTKIIESTPTETYIFSVGDRIRCKGNTGDTIGHYIVDIQEGYYLCDTDITIPHSQQHLFEKFK